MFSGFSAPTTLSVTPTSIERVLLIGGCIFDRWIDVIRAISPEIAVDHRLFQHAMGPDADLGSHDLRIVQLPLRVIMPEYMTMPLGYGDVDGYQAVFDRALDFLRSHLASISHGSRAAPTFVLNYMPPQRNSLGRCMPRYDLRNPVFFVEELNRALTDIAASIPNTHIIDIAEIGAMIGRQRFQDDAFCLNAHGGFVSDSDYYADGERLEPSSPLTQRYPFSVADTIEAFWGETLATYRTLNASDRVKMVCIDLDDTLWRGVMAEQDNIDPAQMEGWPLGLAEALAILRERGIILTIISRNDESRIREIWPQLFSQRLSLDDFAIRKIGWRPKVEAMAEAIAEANVLPDTVVFLDDNPVERAQMRAAYPQVRVIEAPHLDWRRILLWSAETQVPAITDESSRRNDMIRAQVVRETDRASMAPDDFLRSLEINVQIMPVVDAADPHFARALELVNKTNQFNTTGERWSESEADSFFADGGRWVVFKVSDRYTNYGLVGVVAIRGGQIAQMVMSCRIFGLGVEQAVLARLTQNAPLRARIVETPKNGPSRSVFREAGWHFDGEAWDSRDSHTASPAHVLMT